MNKYKEAKETLERYDYSTKLELSEGIRNNITSCITVEQFFVMKEMCIELLDKATPKKPSIAHSINGEAESYCGSCQRRFSTPVSWARISYKHCPECGQKLDWSKDE